MEYIRRFARSQTYDSGATAILIEEETFSSKEEESFTFTCMKHFGASLSVFVPFNLSSERVLTN